MAPRRLSRAGISTAAGRRSASDISDIPTSSAGPSPGAFVLTAPECRSRSVSAYARSAVRSYNHDNQTGETSMTSSIKRGWFAALLPGHRRVRHERAGPVATDAGVAGSQRQVRPAVRRGQRHRHCRAAYGRTAQRQMGQTGGDREPARRRRAGGDQRVHFGQRRSRPALRIERVVHGASLYAGETALRTRARFRSDRAGLRHGAFASRSPPRANSRRLPTS